MSNQVAVQKSRDLKRFFDRPAVQAKIRELVDKNSASFATSIMQIANSNPMLLDADPTSILNAACMAATLNLPINNSLGFAYIVPYRNKGKAEAQFQLGYKGFIQLAQRSGQFERLVSLPVYQNQLIAKDPISGFKFDWEQEPAENEQAIGYYAYFKLINGFTAELYMTRKQIDGHAKRYSQSLKKGYGVWVDNYDAMALKTVIKLLLSRMAPLSVDMQKAVLSDQSVVKDVESGQYEYIDHQANEAENSSGLNDIVGNPSPEEPVIIEYDPVADAAVQPAADAAYRVDPETGEVLDSAAIPETQEGELLL